MNFFQCFVRVDKYTIAYSSSSGDTKVYDLKTHVSDKFGIPNYKQLVKYGGKTLHDNVDLRENVQQDTTVFIYFNSSFLNNSELKTSNRANNSNQSHQSHQS